MYPEEYKMNIIERKLAISLRKVEKPKDPDVGERKSTNNKVCFLKFHENS